MGMRMGIFKTRSKDDLVDHRQEFPIAHFSRRGNPQLVAIAT